MGRWWTGYTSIAGDRACIFHSHGVLWRFASPCCRQSSHGYGLFEATIPSEKMRWIHSLRGAECERKNSTGHHFWARGALHKKSGQKSDSAVNKDFLASFWRLFKTKKSLFGRKKHRQGTLFVQSHLRLR